MIPAQHAPQPLTRPFTPAVHCDLCSETMAEDRAVADATGLNICPSCLEDHLDATTFNASSALGVVGGCGFRP